MDLSLQARAAGWLVFVIGAMLTSVAPAQGQDQHMHESMGAAVSLFPPREASGTAWLPDETPMDGVERPVGSWRVMLHGTVFVQWLDEPGETHRTGGSMSDTAQVSSVNWFMVQARRPVGAARVGLRAMVSLEPWTVGDCGFLNRLATGEMCDGDTIHDRQHPHDLWMELAGDYDRPLRGSLRWQVYAGLSGEPALGPVAFPHRTSAMRNPIAPITHHWLDSSHIAFGLVTTGVYDRRWKAEASFFNGREPDDRRADLDLGPLDSVSGRLTLLPTARLAVQVSAAHLNEAEAEFPPQPRSDVTRLTASASYHRAPASGMVWATTAAYGMNAGPEVIPGAVVDLTTHAALVESTLTRHDRDTWFGRVELVGKPGHDLHAHEAPVRIFPLAKLQAGYVRWFTPWKDLVPGIGATASLAIVPSDLVPRYPHQVMPGFGIFVSVRPSRHRMMPAMPAD